MKQLNIGIIGAGRIGKLHAQSITYAVPAARVYGITDVRTDGLPELKEKFGIEKIYASIDDMLADDQIDAVLVCSSTDTHADIAIQAAKAGKHIFCEKPVDLTPEKVEAVLKAVEQAGVKLQVGFNRRFDHNFARLRELVDQEKIGKLELVKITSRDPEPPPAEYAASSGGMFLDMTIHDFDMARFLAGSDIESLYVQAACLVDPAIGGGGRRGFRRYHPEIQKRRARRDRQQPPRGLRLRPAHRGIRLQGRGAGAERHAHHRYARHAEWRDGRQTALFLLGAVHAILPR